MQHVVLRQATLGVIDSSKWPRFEKTQDRGRCMWMRSLPARPLGTFHLSRLVGDYQRQYENEVSVLFGPVPVGAECAPRASGDGAMAPSFRHVGL